MIHVQLYSISLFLIYTMHILTALCKFQYLNYKANNEIILGVDSVYKDNRQLCLKNFGMDITATLLLCITVLKGPCGTFTAFGHLTSPFNVSRRGNILPLAVACFSHLGDRGTSSVSMCVPRRVKSPF